MKNTVYKPDVKEELVYLKRQIEIVESKLSFTNEPKLVDALSFELLGLRARMGYTIEQAKQTVQCD